MKRRFFFSVFSGSFVVPSFLKWSDLNRDTSLGEVESTKSSTPLSTNEISVKLSPGQQFVLPKNPTVLKTLVFINDGQDWAANPPIVKAQASLLAGRDEPILVDQNSSFALKYLGSETGWTLVNV